MSHDPQKVRQVASTLYSLVYISMRAEHSLYVWAYSNVGGGLAKPAEVFILQIVLG